MSGDCLLTLKSAVFQLVSGGCLLTLKSAVCQLVSGGCLLTLKVSSLSASEWWLSFNSKSQQFVS